MDTNESRARVLELLHATSPVNPDKWDTDAIRKSVNEFRDVDDDVVQHGLRHIEYGLYQREVGEAGRAEALRRPMVSVLHAISEKPCLIVSSGDSHVRIELEDVVDVAWHLLMMSTLEPLDEADARLS